MTPTPEGWEGILAPGETILWQCRPEGRIMWRDLFGFMTLFGLIFTAFSLAWLFGVRAMSSGMPGRAEGLILFEIVGHVFIAVGVYMVIGRIFAEAWLRRRTWYTLTDRAAYLATEVFGRRNLKRIALGEMNLLQLVDTQPGTVWLRQEVHVNRRLGRSPHSRSHARVRTSRQSFGFLHIPEARAVWQRITDLRAARPRDE